jgi:HD-GYP domain-containing protein (c-di-GMP phosphodiesterase class II)
MREKHFDPQLVDLLFENMQQFLEIYKIEVSEENMQKSLTKKIKKDNQIEKLFGWFLHKR